MSARPGRDLAGGVSIRRDDQHARGRAGPHEVAQEEQRRPVRPVDVFEHEQDRRAPSGGGEHVGDRRVQAVALRVGIHSLALGGVAGLERERRQQAPELGAVAAERLGELVRPELPDELLQHLGKGLVRGADHPVAVAVKHERPVAGDVVGELAHEPALARPRFAADERGAATLTRGAGEDCPERRQLVGPAGEGIGRREAEHSRERGRCHDQI